MSESRKMGPGKMLLAGVLAFVLVLIAFYGLNHLVMSLQGLPLNLDLTPAG